MLGHDTGSGSAPVRLLKCSVMRATEGKVPLADHSGGMVPAVAAAAARDRHGSEMLASALHIYPRLALQCRPTTHPTARFPAAAGQGDQGRRPPAQTPAAAAPKAPAAAG